MFECLSCGLVRARYEDELCTRCFDDQQDFPEDDEDLDDLEGLEYHTPEDIMCDLYMERDFLPEYD